MFSKLTSFVLSVLFSLTAAFSCIPTAFWYGGAQYSVKDSENILLDVAWISDTHSDSSYFNERSIMLRRVLCGISQTDHIPDALVICGDVSNASDAREYRMLEWSMHTFNKIGTVLPATGNHDVRARDTYEEARQNFCDFADFCGVKTDKTYYAATVNGYPFIVLGSEDKLSLEADISAEQVEWFARQLQAAQQTNKPIFIVCHQALYNSNGVTFNPEAEKNWGIGAQSAQIEKILRESVPEYPYPVFFISGHLHRDFGESTVDNAFCENLHCITLPSVTKTADGGLGMSMEVYADRVVMTARNYVTMEEITEYVFPIAA